MARDRERAVVGREPRFDRRDGNEVEVIGGFVEDQERRRLRPGSPRSRPDGMEDALPTLKYRLHGQRPPPQPIQLAIPGWGGAPEPRADGSHEQPWHCTPFSVG